MSGALGIACHMSSPLERSACQLCKTLLRIVIGSEAVGSLPHSYACKCAGRETKARYYMPYEQPLGEEARRRRGMDVPRRGTLLRSAQYANCAKRYSVSSSEANSEGSLPHSYANKCAGRETKARYYMPYEQPLGEEARRRRGMDVPRRGTLLRSDHYANCAKRHSVSSSEAKPWALCLTHMRVNA